MVSWVSDTQIPSTHMWHLVLPHFGLGLGIGVVDSALMPLLAFLVEERKSGAYGAVYAIAQVFSRPSKKLLPPLNTTT